MTKLATKKQVLELVGINAIESMFFHYWDKHPRNIRPAMKQAIKALTNLEISTITAESLAQKINL